MSENRTNNDAVLRAAYVIGNYGRERALVTTVSQETLISAERVSEAFKYLESIGLVEAEVTTAGDLVSVLPTPEGKHLVATKTPIADYLASR